MATAEKLAEQGEEARTSGNKGISGDGDWGLRGIRMLFLAGGSLVGKGRREIFPVKWDGFFYFNGATARWATASEVGSPAIRCSQKGMVYLSTFGNFYFSTAEETEKEEDSIPLS